MNYDNRNRIIAHYADHPSDQYTTGVTSVDENLRYFAVLTSNHDGEIDSKFIFANKTGLAAAKIAEICFTPLHLSLLRLICFSAVDFGSDSVTFVGSAIHFAYTLLSQPLSSHSFEGCDAKEQPSLTTMLRTSDASCARCFKNIVMHQRKHLDKESERGGRGKDGRRGGTEHPQHLLITPGELTAKEAIVIGGRKPASMNIHSNKQQKEGRRGRRRAERLRRKGRLNDLKQKTENSDTLEMLTEILMAPTVQTVAIKKQRDLSLVATRTIQKCFDGLLLKAIVDSELEKRGREASPELDTTSNTPKDIPPRSSPSSSPPPRWRRRHQSRGGEHDNSPNYQKPASIFAIEDDEVEGGRHQAAQTGRIAPRGGIGRGESDKDDDVKEPIPIVLQDIVSNILHVQTAQPDQTVLQRQKRKRERRLRNELHSIFKEEEELSTSEEERRRLRPSLQPSRPVRVSPHPAQRIQTAVYCRQIPFRTQTRQPLHFRFLFLASRPALSQQIQRDRIKSIPVIVLASLGGKVTHNNTVSATFNQLRTSISQTSSPLQPFTGINVSVGTGKALFPTLCQSHLKLFIYSVEQSAVIHTTTLS
ncbi:hypothetical protein BLNAU_1966 [Blattamonas nauphoetae]|uniref:Uncharacterized protein n=1 Tax=Blattamonas nauphoetae TaxID=2049346 RepID=A0ABQ9YGQ8_9EUKA|nr:hypothetical protein BLNAU_1966 [Blattamonas nauphoetae]